MTTNIANIGELYATTRTWMARTRSCCRMFPTTWVTRTCDNKNMRQQERDVCELGKGGSTFICGRLLPFGGRGGYEIGDHGAGLLQQRVGGRVAGEGTRRVIAAVTGRWPGAGTTGTRSSGCRCGGGSGPRPGSSPRARRISRPRSRRSRDRVEPLRFGTHHGGFQRTGINVPRPAALVHSVPGGGL